MKPGDVVIAHAGTKPRPCVVLRNANDGALVVVAGTRTERPEVSAVVRVRASSQAGKAMRLDADTYFYPKVERIVAAEVRATGGRCPLEIYTRIRELVGYR